MNYHKLQKLDVEDKKIILEVFGMEYKKRKFNVEKLCQNTKLSIIKTSKKRRCEINNVCLLSQLFVNYVFVKKSKTNKIS